MKGTCNDCKYGVLESRYKDPSIICKRYPQTTIDTPRFTLDNWCGEWQPKEETE